MARRAFCPFRKLYPTILMVKATAEDSASDNGARGASFERPAVRGCGVYGLCRQPQIPHFL